MKKRIFAMLTVLALALTMLAACSKSDSGSGGGAGSSGSNSSGGAGSGKTYELSFTIHDPSTSAKVAYYQTLCDQVYEQTDGGVKITIFPGGTLLAGTDVMEGVMSGTADIGWLFTTFFPEQFPMTDIASLPMAYKDNIQSTSMLLDLYEQSEILQKELSNYKILGMTCNPINYIYSTTPVRSVSDMKGLVIRATAGVATDMVSAWGGSPTLMAPNDLYESMNKKTLDGYVFEWSGNNSYNLAEVIDYCTELPITCGTFLVAMNLEKWNSLPEEYQQVIDNVWDREASLAVAQVFLDDSEVGRQKAIDQGVEIITPDDAATAEFKVAADTYAQKWVEKYDAQEYYDLAMEYAAKY